MTRQWLRYTISAIVFYLVFLVVTAPAVWTAWALVRFTHGMASLNETEGTIWHGRGDLVIHAGSAPPQRLGVIRWSVNPLWGFVGKVGVYAHLSGPDAGVEGNLRLGYRRLALSGLTASFPAQLAASIYSPLGLLSPSGQVRVDSKTISIDRAGIHGSAIVQWQGAGSSLSSVRPLGDYRLHFDGHGKTAAIRLEPVSGDLQVSGQGTWQLGSGQFHFSGIAKPTAQATELEPLLRMIGPDTGAGERHITVNTIIKSP